MLDGKHRQPFVAQFAEGHLADRVLDVYIVLFISLFMPVLVLVSRGSSFCLQEPFCKIFLFCCEDHMYLSQSKLANRACPVGDPQHFAGGSSVL